MPRKKRSSIHELSTGEKVEGNGRPIVTPKEFSSGSWSDYVAYFEKVSEINNWSSEVKAKFLAISLSGESLKVYNALPESITSDYNLVKEAIGAKLEPVERQSSLRESFKQRRQAKGESLSAFAMDLQALFRQSFPETFTGPARDYLLKEQFIQGLRDSSLRLRVALEQPTSIDAALSKALVIEGILSTYGAGSSSACQVVGESEEQAEVQGVSGCHPPDRLVELDQKVAALTKSIEELKASIGRGKVAIRRGPRCWGCGEEGHVRARCPRGPQQGN